MLVEFIMLNLGIAKCYACDKRVTSEMHPFVSTCYDPSHDHYIETYGQPKIWHEDCAPIHPVAIVHNKLRRNAHLN